jgi:hypothetical protein
MQEEYTRSSGQEFGAVPRCVLTFLWYGAWRSIQKLYVTLFYLNYKTAHCTVALTGSVLSKNGRVAADTIRQ